MGQIISVYWLLVTQCFSCILWDYKLCFYVYPFTEYGSPCRYRYGIESNIVISRVAQHTSRARGQEVHNNDNMTSRRRELSIAAFDLFTFWLNNYAKYSTTITSSQRIRYPEQAVKLLPWRWKQLHFLWTRTSIGTKIICITKIDICRSGPQILAIN